MRIAAPRESGKPAVGFPLFRGSSGQWECGNRGAISKGGGKGGKRVFGFPGFPRTVISTDIAVWGDTGSLGSLAKRVISRSRRA